VEENKEAVKPKARGRPPPKKKEDVEEEPSPSPSPSPVKSSRGRTVKPKEKSESAEEESDSASEEVEEKKESEASEEEKPDRGKAKTTKERKRKRKEEDEDEDFVDDGGAPKKKKTEQKEKKTVSAEEQKLTEEIKQLRAVVTACGLRVPRIKVGTALDEKLAEVKAFMKEQGVSAGMTKKQIATFKADLQKKKDLDLAAVNPKKIIDMKSRTRRDGKRKNYKDPGSDEEVSSSNDSEEVEKASYTYLDSAKELREDLRVEAQEEVELEGAEEKTGLEWFPATVIREFAKEPGKWRIKFDDGTRADKRFEKGKWRIVA